MLRKISNAVSKVLTFVFVVGVFLSIFLPSVDAYNARFTTNHNQYFEKTVNVDSSRSLYVFYDYGTWTPGDNARIKAKTKGFSNNFAAIKYKNLKDTQNLDYETYRSWGQYEHEAYVDMNPGYDYMAPGSYAYSEGDKKDILEVRVK